MLICTFISRYDFMIVFVCIALSVAVMECLEYTTKGGKETIM